MNHSMGWMGHLALAASLAALVACGGSDGDGGSGSGGAGAGEGGSGGAQASSSSTSGVTVGGGGDIGEVQTHSVTIGPFDVPPGQERTMCVVVDVGNDLGGMLRRIRTELTEGSHHLIVTKVAGTTPQPVPQPCGAFAHGGDALFIAEKPSMELTYPDGTGLPFAPHQLVGLEMHYINASGSENLSISGTVQFDIAIGDVPLKEVQLLFAGHLNISIPPQGSDIVTGNIPVPSGAHIFALTSHMHRLGVHATIERTVGGSPVELLHVSDSWAEPPFDVFQPAVALNPGDGLNLTCEFINPTDQTVTFGTGYYDEMCFLWAHYTLD